MFHLTIATLEKVIYEDEVSSLILPGAMGYFEILTNHAAIITFLKAGKVTIVTHKQEKLFYSITGGVFEFSHNKGALLADSIEIPSSN